MHLSALNFFANFFRERLTMLNLRPDFDDGLPQKKGRERGETQIYRTRAGRQNEEWELA